MRLTITTLFLVFLAPSGCEEDTSRPDGFTQHVGIVAWDDAPAGFEHFENPDPSSGHWTDDNLRPGPPLVAPDSVQQGAPFEVTVTTVLPNGCWQPGPHHTELGASTATITVYDYHTAAELCTTEFGWKSRAIELRFDVAGEATVRVIGRRVAGEKFGGDEKCEVKKSIVVH